MEKIAVFLKENDEIGSFTESKCVNIFVNEYGGWLIKKKLNVDLSNVNNMKAIRETFLKLISEMEDCRIVVVNKAFGIPYSVFYAEDFSVWELEGNPLDFLDEIIKSEIEQEELDNEENEIGKKLSEGHYFIDLQELEIANPEMSSKKAIIPYLEKEDVKKIEVHCCHVPPWLVTKMDKGEILLSINEIKRNDYMVTVQKNVL